MEYVRCAICDADSTAVVSTRGILEKQGTTRSVRNVMCRRCGLIYINPRPTAAEYAELYSRYEKHRYGIDTQDETDEFADKRAGVADKRTLIRCIASFVAVPPRKIRALDIGCAHGVFAEALKRELGCMVEGIEPSGQLAAAARRRAGMDVFVGGFDGYLRAVPETSRFHVIILNHVFEHFVDPARALDGLGRLLAPGGIAYVEVPDVSDFKKPVERFFDLCHPYSYSPATLRSILERFGWKAVGRARTKAHRLQAIAAPTGHPSPAERWDEGGDPGRLRAALLRKQIGDRVYRTLLPLYRRFRNHAPA